MKSLKVPWFRIIEGPPLHAEAMYGLFHSKITRPRQVHYHLALSPVHKLLHCISFDFNERNLKWDLGNHLQSFAPKWLWKYSPGHSPDIWAALTACSLAMISKAVIHGHTRLNFKLRQILQILWLNFEILRFRAVLFSLRHW